MCQPEGVAESLRSQSSCFWVWYRLKRLFLAEPVEEAGHVLRRADGDGVLRPDGQVVESVVIDAARHAGLACPLRAKLDAVELAGRADGADEVGDLALSRHTGEALAELLARQVPDTRGDLFRKSAVRTHGKEDQRRQPAHASLLTRKQPFTPSST